MSGMSHVGGFASGWCHRKAQPYCSWTGHARRRRERLGRSWYGMRTLCPSGAQTQPWKGPFDAVALDPPAVSDVGSEVRTVALEHVEHAVVAAVGDKVLAEIPQWPRRTGRELGGPADLEPPRRLPGERDIHDARLPEVKPVGNEVVIL